MHARRLKGIARGVALVSNHGALIPVHATVVATQRRRGVSFAKPCPLCAASCQHVRSTVVLAANDAFGYTGGWLLHYSVEQAANLHGEPVVVIGNSLSLPTTNAIGAAVTGKSVQADVVATGSVSRDGRVEMVRGLPEKLQIGGARKFLIPDWKNDHTFKSLYPDEYVAVRAAVAMASLSVRTVATVAQAFAEATAPSDVHQLVEMQPAFERSGDGINEPNGEPDDVGAIRSLLHQCSDEYLAQRVDRDIDEKFAAYRWKSQVIDTTEAVIRLSGDIIAHVTGNADQHSSEIKATRLIEQAYSQRAAFAYSCALTGEQGGMRAVVNRMIEQAKAERRELAVREVIARNVDMADAEQRMRLARAALSLFGHIIPNNPSIETVAASLEEFIAAMLTAKTHLRHALTS